MANRISDTIKRLFPDELEELVPVKRHWWQKINWSTLNKGWRFWAIVASIALVAFFSVHYYNKFVVLETQVLTDMAQIEAQMQRRKDLIVNLTKTVIDYAEHERKMFVYMADKRSDSLAQTDKLEEILKKEGILDPKKGTVDLNKLKDQNLNSVLASLMALAENYPDLKLSSNFQKLMDALVNIEDKIVERRMAYNESCNKYGTYIRKFPQNIYSFMFGFKQYPFVEVDKDVALFDRIEY